MAAGVMCASPCCYYEESRRRAVVAKYKHKISVSQWLYTKLNQIMLWFEAGSTWLLTSSNENDIITFGNVILVLSRLMLSEFSSAKHWTLTAELWVLSEAKKNNTCHTLKAAVILFFFYLKLLKATCGAAWHKFFYLFKRGPDVNMYCWGFCTMQNLLDAI